VGGGENGGPELAQEREREKGREEGREEVRQRRDFDLLKHVSTLNVISLVLVEALLKDVAAPPPVALFGISLLIAMIGLFLTLRGREAGLLVRGLAAVSYLLFLGGLGWALIVPGILGT
jgi:hypothetical protein